LSSRWRNCKRSRKRRCAMWRKAWHDPYYEFNSIPRSFHAGYQPFLM
jgi:hypothetical protein